MLIEFIVCNFCSVAEHEIDVGSLFLNRFIKIIFRFQYKLN